MSDQLEEIKTFSQSFGPNDLQTAYHHLQWLITEVERLREARETLSKQVNGMIIVDDTNRIESLNSKLSAVTKERGEYLEIINLYEDAQGKGIQTIIERNKNLEAEIAKLKHEGEVE